jgi:WD40 repeat protein
MRVDKADGELALVGGNDKTLTIYKHAGGDLTKLWAVSCDAAPRAVDMFNGNILIGLKNGSICEMPYTGSNASTKPNVVMTSHCDGEVWGLDVVSLGGGELRMLTSADDNRVLAYNPKTKMVLAEGVVNQPATKKVKDKGGFRGGASSMSSQPANCQSRCVAYNDTLKHMAVADNKGIVTIRDLDWAAVDARQPGSLDQVKKTLFKEIKKAAWIEVMVFSPDSKYLAVGSHDDQIYLVDTKTYKKHIKLTGHSSFITAIDWAIDGSFIRSVCGAYELLFFNIGTKKRDPSGASNTIGTVWANQTCKLGWNV